MKTLKSYKEKKHNKYFVREIMWSTITGHFRVLLCLCFKTSLRTKPFIWKWLLHAVSFSCKSKPFSCERFCVKTHLKKLRRSGRFSFKSERRFRVLLTFNWNLDTNVVFLMTRVLSVVVSGFCSSNLIKCSADISLISPSSDSLSPPETESSSTPAIWPVPERT